MNPGRLFFVSKQVALFALALATIALPNAILGVAQERASSSKPKPEAASRAHSDSPAADNDYSRKIKEYTTEPYFLTELVDHLPMSEKVPSPDKVLGYVVGTPNKLTYTKNVHRYFREIAKASPRVRVFTAPERSEEGKEQILVAVGDEALLAKLDRYKEISAKLADPRRISESEAQKLIGEGKAFYWASGSIHSPETGSPEMLMESRLSSGSRGEPFYSSHSQERNRVDHARTRSGWTRQDG